MFLKNVKRGYERVYLSCPFMAINNETLKLGMRNMHTDHKNIGLGAFAASELDKVFSGYHKNA
jgi:hypothetical protein